MIVITGGAGFIGSCLLKRLNEKGFQDIIIAESFRNLEKWKNLAGKNFIEILSQEELLEKLSKKEIRPHTVFHLGACSDTTNSDVAYLMENNYRYSVKLLKLCLENDIRFIYASSAATYGNGEYGYSDSLEIIPKLKPLNMYAITKQLFDMYILQNNLIEKVVGLKYFNVFGPNEYHKGYMRSVVLKGYYQIKETGKIKLFKSYKEGIPHGHQKRDFIYVKDAVDITIFFMENPDIVGIYNVGTGIPHTFEELAINLFKSLGKACNIEYIDMPESLKERYQYYTCADLTNLRKAGYNGNFTEFSVAIEEYVKKYLILKEYY